MHSDILIKNGHIIDPSQDIDAVGDILIENGKIIELRVKSSESGVKDNSKLKTQNSKLKIIDATGLSVLPGLVDMHVHLREPGFDYKETIKTGTMAAVKGGITSVCCMPNTNPVNDNETVTEFILRKTYAEGACYVYPVGAITKGQKGEELAEMGMMKDAGCVAFSDDGRPVMSSLIMRRALEYSKAFNVPVISHCEDMNLSEGGVVNEGRLSAQMGLKGIPSASEDVMVARDIILAELTGGRLHIAHVSTEGSVRLIRQAKERGVNVTAETCPHYFTITEDSVKGYNTNAKVNPPLRTQKDVEAIIKGLKDGTIDAIATDHAPHHRDEKLQEFDKAPSGISGFETALSLSLRLVYEGILTMSQLVEKMALVPARILGIDAGTLKVGFDADIAIVDMNKEFKVESEKFLSKGKNTPFEGWTLKGMPVITICKGKVYDWRIDE
ncbi:MAG: dihydroorotase [Nitrospiraceae bacterium]|nr:dihydroorotase [Nitrospirota bacterium]MDA8339559.1 dihydroorotase [Nitrospiraceae bacterium]